MGAAAFSGGVPMHRFFMALAFTALLLLSGAARAEQDLFGSDCEGDCSGQRAGYSWARQNNVTDEDVCQDRAEASAEFVRGCKAYVAEREDAGDSEDE